MDGNKPFGLIMFQEEIVIIMYYYNFCIEKKIEESSPLQNPKTHLSSSESANVSNKSKTKISPKNETSMAFSHIPKLP